ncbi:Mu transposase/integrase [Oscillatoria acuminata PCC 6304]|uniref:Mu transposase/integrase n=2 Tax=Oscillatoria acuminata TaxID=118323 RepID=K9TMS3_9CYAN|nr:Mu transposase/integrase [Oscillatoria acuminata PCC 6304]
MLEPHSPEPPLPPTSSTELPLDRSDSVEETNIIIRELSEEAQLRMEVIESLLEPCDRATYGEKLREGAKKLGKTVRTVQRLVKKYQSEGLAALSDTSRGDKGQHRIHPFWEDFILKTYAQGNKGGKRMSRKQVALRVEAKAMELGRDDYPSYRTVYRVLTPIIEQKEQKKTARSIGWHGSRLSLKTRAGQDLAVEYSNHVWQCDHTLVDLLLVDRHGVLIGRPWLTTVIDTYSRCIMGINLGFDAPSSQVVALALRHGILPKHYGPEYSLHCEWGTYGIPQHFYTDGGKDFRSNHLTQISVQLGFVCHLRDRPSEGGIVERPFGTLNTELFAALPGYTGSNVQQRSKEAEKEASLTLGELDRLLVRYICDRYNQSIDARLGDQSRFQRWEAGLLAAPPPLSERELDVCLMKEARRRIARGGYVNFQNLTYRGENLAGYGGEWVVLRYHPRDITKILIYLTQKGQEEFLARAYALDLEAEELSLDEAKANAQKIREAGKSVNNRSILHEVHDRQIFVDKKHSDRLKSRKARRQDEQKELRSPQKLVEQPEPEEVEADEILSASESETDVEVLDYDQLQEDWGL